MDRDTEVPEAGPQPPKGRRTVGFGWGLAAILAVAAALRLALLEQTLSNPLLRDLLILDSRLFAEAAEHR
jgi:hypothetical protein